MAEKVFISYNHSDKFIVDTIARRLEIEFGRNNIFYDAWSMQPGDSIIGKMNAGLEDFTTFFFFVSDNSLQSNMVKLEWQTALNRAINRDLKFVSIRISDCSMPAILTDKLYIDLYGEGLDSAVEKMRCVIKGENVYAPLEDVQNVIAYCKKKDSHSVDIEISATHFVVHNPTVAIGITVSEEHFTIKQLSEGMVISGKDIIATSDGQEFTAKTFGLCRALMPGQPFKASLQLDKNIQPVSIACFLKQGKTDDGYSMYQDIPCQEILD